MSALQILAATDPHVWLILLLKIGIAALVVITVTVTAERAGPVAGAFLATLPVSGGPAYVLLALDHGDAFIAESALFTLAMNPVIAIYALSFVLLAQRQNATWSTLVPAAVWLLLAFLVRQIQWTPLSAVLLNLAVIPACYAITRPYRDIEMPKVRLRAFDLVVRAGLTALIATLILLLSFEIGPSGSGVLAVFPVVYFSVMLLMQRRVGGRAAAALVAHGFLGMPGFSLAVLALHFTAVPLGRALALCLALAVSLFWNLLTYGLQWRARTRPKKN